MTSEPQSPAPDAPPELPPGFLRVLPTALPSPPRLLALPAPATSTMPRVATRVMRSTAAASAPAPPPPAPAAAPPDARATPSTPAPSRPAPFIREPDLGPFPAPPPLTGVHAPTPTGAAAEQEEDLAASPWDPGFDPPKDAIGTDPHALGPDPRMLSLNRRRGAKTAPTSIGAKRASGVAPSPSSLASASPPPPPTFAPPPPKKVVGPPEAPTHDILVLPQNPTFKTAEQGVNAVLTYLRTAQLLAYRARRDLPDETVFELAPDVFVHQIFTEGQAPGGPPSALEATLRVSKTPRPVPFGPPGRTTCFSLALVGCRFSRLSEAFKARLHQIIFLRPEQHPLPHDPARLRANADAPPQPIPAFDVQEVDRG